MADDDRLHTDATLGPWLVDAADFPTAGTTADLLRFLVRYAVLAPSAHNAQPWLFDVGDDHLDVVFDPRRGLSVSDPKDRESTISVGAAVEFLCLASQHFGYATTVEPFPDPKDPLVCARIRLAGDAEEPPGDAELFANIPLRRTSRLPFDGTPVEPGDLAAVAAEAEPRNSHLVVLTSRQDKRPVATLVAHADREQMADARFRRELATWLRPNASLRADGMRGYRIGLTELQSMAAPLIVRTFDIGAGRAAHDQELADGSPALALLWTDADDRSAWLSAGRALARILLRATARRLWAGFLDQPIEVAGLRDDLARTVGVNGYPQILLRLGHGAPPSAQPRRHASDLLVDRSVSAGVPPGAALV